MVTGMTDRSWFAAAVVCYGVAAVYAILLWRQGFRRDAWIHYGLLFLGFLPHGAAMLMRGFSLSSCPINNLYEAIMFIAWTMVAVVLVLGWWPPLRFLGVFASPLLLAMGIFALAPALDAPSAAPTTPPLWRSLHATMTLLSCGAFGIGAVAGAMFLIQERDLKRRRLQAVISRLPSIQRLERTMDRLLWAATALMLGGMVTGSLWLRQSQRASGIQDPIVGWTLAIWLFYLGLLVWRWKYAQRGRRFAWGAVAGFVVIALTFWAVYLLSPIHRP